MNLPAWEQRPQEEANLFNPAFCALVLIEFVKEFRKSTGKPCPYALLFCALPLALHGKTRAALPGTTLTSLYSWRERNPEALVGFAERARSLRPVVQEAVRFAVDRKGLAFSPDGNVDIGPQPVAAGKKFDEGITHDVRDCLTTSRMLGRWLAKAGSTSTIMAAWGVKP